MPNTITLNNVMTTLQHTVRHSPAFDIVDATGVGAPVVDMLRKADLPCRLMPVTITGGEHDAPVRGGYHVPKRELLTGLQVLVQSGGLQISAEADAGGCADSGDGGDEGGVAG